MNAIGLLVILLLANVQFEATARLHNSALNKKIENMAYLEHKLLMHYILLDDLIALLKSFKQEFNRRFKQTNKKPRLSAVKKIGKNFNIPLDWDMTMSSPKSLGSLHLLDEFRLYRK